MAQTLSVIVPVHNESACIRHFYDRAKPVLESLGAAWEIVFVNDASEDDSLERITALRREDPRVKFLTLSRNFGYHAALMAGISSRESDLYAIIDVDCEDPPEMLAQFYSEISKGAHTAYGIRSQRDEPAGIIFFRWLFYWINRQIADGPVRLWMAEFSMMTRTVRDAVLAHKTTFPFLRAELGYVGYRMTGIPYFRARRQHGASHYNFFQMTKFALAGFLSSSTFPLRFALYLSGFMAASYAAVVAAFSLDLARAAQVAAIGTFVFALLTVPILALYLARTYKNVSPRPVFYVDPGGTQLS